MDVPTHSTEVVRILKAKRGALLKSLSPGSLSLVAGRAVMNGDSREDGLDKYNIFCDWDHSGDPTGPLWRLNPSRTTAQFLY
ncbi:hypothetical protein ACOMHN_001051 [Nucella lapillus]